MQALALLFPPALIPLTVATMMAGSYYLLFGRNKSYPAVSCAIDSLGELFSSEPEITKGTKVNEETKKEFLNLEIKNIDVALKQHVTSVNTKSMEYSQEIQANKVTHKEKIVENLKTMHADSVSILDNKEIAPINAEIGGDSLIDVLRDGFNLKTDQQEKVLEFNDDSISLMQNHNALLKEQNEIAMGQLSIMQHSLLNQEHLITVLTDTLHPISENLALFPHLIKTINLGNVASIEALNITSEIEASKDDADLLVQEEIATHLSKSADLAEFNLHGSRDALTWSGQTIKPALAKAKKDYELSKTEGQMNRLDAFDLDTFDTSEFNILSYMMNQIREEQ